MKVYLAVPFYYLAMSLNILLLLGGIFIMSSLHGQLPASVSTTAVLFMIFSFGCNICGICGLADGNWNWDRKKTRGTVVICTALALVFTSAAVATVTGYIFT